VVKDGNGNMTAYNPVQVTTRQDTDAPVAGSSGMISASSVTATSAEINWTAATDNIDSILSYKVVTASTAEAVDTAEEINAMTGSSVVKDWSDNLTTAPISGLIPKSTCYVNVAVKDGSGNLAAYTPVVVTTPPEKLYLFKTINSDGNLGGRTGADQIVSDYEKKPAGVTVTVAFLSVSASDQLCDIPKNYGFPTDLPIYGPDGTVKIADNWVDLMDGRIDAPLDTAGVLKGGLDESYWWSGSNSDGTAHSETCRGWTDNKRATGGKVGVSFQSSNSWISSTTHPGDDSWNFVLGLGY